MNRLKELREARGLNMKQLSALLNMPYTTYVNYEKGLREPNSETLIQLAAFFNVSIDYLIGKADNSSSAIPPGFQPLPEMVQVPLVGQIACGDPITAEENIEDIVSIPAEWHADFSLKCIGESMLPRIHDGDIVGIRKQPCVENGEIAAVRIDGEATLKHVYLYPDRMVLQPENQAFAPIVLIGEEMNTVKIEGKAVGLCRGL